MLKIILCKLNILLISFTIQFQISYRDLLWKHFDDIIRCLYLFNLNTWTTHLEIIIIHLILLRKKNDNYCLPLYSLYLYFFGLSLRNTSITIGIFKYRTNYVYIELHTDVWLIKYLHMYKNFFHNKINYYSEG